MPLQSLIFTALPNGITPDGRSLRVSILISPRLDNQAAPAMLSSFADWVAWPETLRQADITVTLGTTTVAIGAAQRDGSIGTADADTWRALFPETTYVRAHTMRDRSEDVVVSYDTVALDELVKKLYGDAAAASDDDLPTVPNLLANPAIKALVGNVRNIDRMAFDSDGKRDVSALLAAYRKDRLKGIDTADAPLGTFQLFNTPPARPTSQQVSPVHDPRLAVSWSTHEQATINAEKAVEAIDFHQIAAAMNQYPSLLRRLGFVVDVMIPRDGVATDADLALSVKVTLPRATEPANSVHRVTRRAAFPVTRVRLTERAFTAVSRPSGAESEYRVSDGLLVLEPKRFALLQADVDGAGNKLLNFARTLAGKSTLAKQYEPVSREPRRMGMPALRNAGLMLVHRGRGQALTGAFMRTTSRDAAVQQQFGERGALPAANVTLYAEDIVRGWRVDVHDRASDRWRSLCERIARYEIGPDALVLDGLREEGSVRLAATSSADPTYNTDVVYLHEAVVVWNGWSLVASQPGRAVAPDESLRDASADVPDGVRLRSHFVVAPGSLPRLRYGRVYGVRARVVDLAGNSLPPSTSSEAGDETSLVQVYRRFEPIQPPGFALVETAGNVELPSHGESMARVAVRTFNEVFDDPAVANEEARRWAVAPRVSQREAELHGVLDGAAWGTSAQFTLLAERDKELAHIDVPLPAGTDIGEEKNAQGVPLSPRLTRYAVLPDRAKDLPYLPDPLSTHVVARFRHLPGVDPRDRIEIPLYSEGSAWPNAAPFRIQVYEEPGKQPHWEEASRTLMVPVPKATRATVRLASMLAPESIDLMGVWECIQPALRTAALRKRAEQGALWPLTPWRELELVHAVQRPLRAPVISELMIQRPLGATWVRPGIDARCHRASTDRLDLLASWNEPTDDVHSNEPGNRTRDDVAFSVKVIDPQGGRGLAEHVIPDAADTDRIALSMPKLMTAEQLAETPAKLHDFGDTRYRRVEYRLSGTSRFREYMPLATAENGAENGAGNVAMTEADLTVAGPVVRTWVPASEAPPAPEVLDVVPTFGWTRVTDSAGRQTRWRRGGGLRVWLDRPWNASGYGEMLAVVLAPSGQGIDPNDAPFKHAVTQWGNDPAWKSPFVAGTGPTRSMFPLARTAADPTGSWLPPGALATEADQVPAAFQTQGLTHPGLADGEAHGHVDIAPHDVFWDAERRLWYCDIEIAHGESYFPFVRLALARYQPCAKYAAMLSTIVLADFSALSADRWLTVTRTTATRRQVSVYGYAPTESSGHAEAWKHRTQQVNRVTGRIDTFVPTGIVRTNVVEVWLEQLNAAMGEDFGWRRVSQGGMSPATTGSAPVPATSTTSTTGASTLTIRERRLRARELASRGDYTTLAAESLLELSLDWPNLWSGTIVLPRTPSPTTRYRIVVAEYEEYLTDGPDPYAEPLAAKGRRLVFVEHIEVT